MAIEIRELIMKAFVRASAEAAEDTDTTGSENAAGETEEITAQLALDQVAEFIKQQKER
jgi:hypothetical protein